MEEIRINVTINKKGSSYTASGNMTGGLIKLLIGELEIIKSRLIFDLEKSLDDGYTKKEA